MDSVANEVSLKLKSAIKAKLMEIGAYVDDELPNYVLVLITNRRSKPEIEKELSLFLGAKTPEFSDWLETVSAKLEQVTLTNLSAGESSGKRKNSDDEKKKKKKVKKEDLVEEDDLRKIHKDRKSSISSEGRANKKQKSGKSKSSVHDDDDFFDIDSAGSDMDFCENRDASPKKMKIKTSGMHADRMESSAFGELDLDINCADFDLDEDVNTNSASFEKESEGILSIGDDDFSYSSEDSLSPPSSKNSKMRSKSAKWPSNSSQKEQMPITSAVRMVSSAVSRPESSRQIRREVAANLAMSDIKDAREVINRKRRLASAEEHLKATRAAKESAAAATVSSRKDKTGDERTRESIRTKELTLCNLRGMLLKMKNEEACKSVPIESTTITKRSGPDGKLERTIINNIEAPHAKRSSNNVRLVAVEDPPVKSTKRGVIASGNLIRKAVADAHRSLLDPSQERVKKPVQKVAPINIKNPEKHSKKHRKKEMNVIPTVKIHGDSSSESDSRSGESEEDKRDEITEIISDIAEEESNHSEPVQPVEPAKEMTPTSFSIDSESVSPPDSEKHSLSKAITEYAANTETDEPVEEYDEREKSPKFVVTLTGVDPVYGAPQSELPPAMSKEAPPRDEPGLPKPKSGERCRFWPNCTNKEKCVYYHPSMPCKMFPGCKFGNTCMFIHPPCKFGPGCSRFDCPYMHTAKGGPGSHFPAPSPHSGMPLRGAQISNNRPCKFFPKCGNPVCPFQHVIMCRFGKFCSNKNCTFTHPSAPTRAPINSKFVWVRPNLVQPPTPTQAPAATTEPPTTMSAT